MPAIGNIVKSKRADKHGIVLAVRKDGTRAKVYVYGPDEERWYPVTHFTVETEGLETCYKCVGSGLYYYGGPVVNGVYQGKTGVCYGCGGKGKQSDDDRKRCHYYWHRKVEAGEDIESPLEQTPVPEAKPEPAPKRVKIRSKPVRKRDPRSTVVQPANELDKLRMSTAELDELRDRGENISHERCPDCGTGHRYDVPCL
jgi:hypothetical protein